MVEMRVLLAFLLVSLSSAFVPTSTSLHAASSSSISALAASRVPFIAGNWKMNTDLSSAVDLAAEVAKLTSDVKPSDVEVAVIPPYPFLTAVGQALGQSSVKLGAQNCFFEDKGAFTGGVSAPMLASVGAKYVLVGHSERRSVFKESDADINKSLLRIQSANMTPILCIGETREEFELGINEQICTMQLSRNLKGVSKEAVKNLVVAYEPVWAIGTGLTATPAIAQSVHAVIRAWFKKAYGEDIAEAVRILYGGSVTPETVDELMACPDIDGALVGGASLKAASFSRIVHFQRLAAASATKNEL